ncbi:uncharacterized protein LOC101862077 [Aplysia californica]|uniref:Uncharacterized protein LOC101862077 n=1 Tax=Aplysia californica TaxID=6500 RepID=A0ABM0K7S2_APLCA|nr:uncharacterized protein LOC101862077 [Aplysia californica]
MAMADNILGNSRNKRCLSQTFSSLKNGDFKYKSSPWEGLCYYCMDCLSREMPCGHFFCSKERLFRESPFIDLVYEESSRTECSSRDLLNGECLHDARRSGERICVECQNESVRVLVEWHSGERICRECKAETVRIQDENNSSSPADNLRSEVEDSNPRGVEQISPREGPSCSVGEDGRRATTKPSSRRAFQPWRHLPAGRGRGRGEEKQARGQCGESGHSSLCHYVDDGEGKLVRDFRTQVTATDIKPSREAQTGSSLRLEKRGESEVLPGVLNDPSTDCLLLTSSDLLKNMDAENAHLTSHDILKNMSTKCVPRLCPRMWKEKEERAESHRHGSKNMPKIEKVKARHTKTVADFPPRVVAPDICVRASAQTEASPRAEGSAALSGPASAGGVHGSESSQPDARVPCQTPSCVARGSAGEGNHCLHSPVRATDIQDSGRAQTCPSLVSTVDPFVPGERARRKMDVHRGSRSETWEDLEFRSDDEQRAKRSSPDKQKIQNPSPDKLKAESPLSDNRKVGCLPPPSPSKQTPDKESSPVLCRVDNCPASVIQTELSVAEELLSIGGPGVVDRAAEDGLGRGALFLAQTGARYNSSHAGTQVVVLDLGTCAHTQTEECSYLTLSPDTIKPKLLESVGHVSTQVLALNLGTCTHTQTAESAQGSHTKLNLDANEQKLYERVFPHTEVTSVTLNKRSDPQALAASPRKVNHSYVTQMGWPGVAILDNFSRSRLHFVNPESQQSARAAGVVDIFPKKQQQRLDDLTAPLADLNNYRQSQSRVEFLPAAKVSVNRVCQREKVADNSDGAGGRMKIMICAQKEIACDEEDNSNKGDEKEEEEEEKEGQAHGRERWDEKEEHSEVQPEELTLLLRDRFSDSLQDVGTAGVTQMSKGTERGGTGGGNPGNLGRRQHVPYRRKRIRNCGPSVSTQTQGTAGSASSREDTPPGH